MFSAALSSGCWRQRDHCEVFRHLEFARGVPAGLVENNQAVCAGCNGEFGVDDALVAGALAEALDQEHALVSLYRSVRGNLAETLLGSDAGRELLQVGLEKDVPSPLP